MFHGRLSALQSRGSVLSPVSLLTDQEDLLAATGGLITPGIPVQITEDQGILFAGIPLEISFRNAAGHDLALSPCLDPLRLSDLAGQLLYTISSANDHGFHQLFLPDADIGSSFVLSAAQQRIQSCMTKFAAAYLIPMISAAPFSPVHWKGSSASLLYSSPPWSPRKRSAGSLPGSAILQVWIHCPAFIIFYLCNVFGRMQKYSLSSVLHCTSA